MTVDDVRKILAGACSRVGGIRAFARLHNISAPYISRVLSGEKEPADVICKALELKRTVSYSKKARPND